MAQMKNRRIVLAARPAGGPADTDFLLEVMEGGTVNEMVASKSTHWRPGTLVRSYPTCSGSARNGARPFSS